MFLVEDNGPPGGVATLYAKTQVHTHLDQNIWENSITVLMDS